MRILKEDENKGRDVWLIIDSCKWPDPFSILKGGWITETSGKLIMLSIHITTNH